MSSLMFENSKQKESVYNSNSIIENRESLSDQKSNNYGKYVFLQKKETQGYSKENSSLITGSPIVLEVIKSSGQPLDKETKAFMEPKFKHDFSKVRVHTNAKAAKSARTINALAYTIGHNVVFRDGYYAPNLGIGRQLLAHELTHVIQQQMSGMREGTYSLQKSQNAELEAEGISKKLNLSDNLKPPIYSSPVMIQKKPEEENQTKSNAYTWEKIKWTTVNGMINGLKLVQRSGMSALRSLSNHLPDILKAIANLSISFFEFISDSIIFFLLGVVGLLTGLGQGIVEAVIGLVKFSTGLIKGLLLWYLGLFSPKFRKLYMEWVGGITSTLSKIGPQIKALLANKWNEISTASPEKLAFLIGELTGEFIAILAQLEIGGGIAGAVPKLELPMRLPALAYVGVRAPATAVVATIDVASPVVALAGTGAAMSRISEGDVTSVPKVEEYNNRLNKNAANKSSHKKIISSHKPSLKGPPKKPGKILSEERVNDKIIIKSEVGDSPGRLGLEKTLPSNTKLSSKGWERAHSQGNITGAESSEGIRYAPGEVNQAYQKTGIERFIVDFNNQKVPGAKIYLTTETTTHAGTLRLKSITYRIDVEMSGSKTRLYEAEITIQNSTKNPIITISADQYGDIERFLKPIQH